MYLNNILIYLSSIFATKNKKPVRESKKMYEFITQKIQEAKEQKLRVIVLGDLNAKVGTTIQGNKEAITKVGRLLFKMIVKENMNSVNAGKHKSKGLWRREKGKDKSVIDHVMINKVHLNNMKKMIIDETKEHVFYRLKQQIQDHKKTYSVYKVILLKIDFYTEMQNNNY